MRYIHLRSGSFQLILFENTIDNYLATLSGDKSQEQLNEAQSRTSYMVWIPSDGIRYEYISVQFHDLDPRKLIYLLDWAENTLESISNGAEMRTGGSVEILFYHTLSQLALAAESAARWITRSWG